MRTGGHGTPKKDKESWVKIYNEYIKTYGLSSLYERMLKTMERKAMAELDYCITGDRIKLTEAEIEETKLAQMMNNKGQGMSIQKTLIHLSKWIGYWLKTDEISAEEYFNLLQEFEKINKVNNGEKNRN